MWFVGKLSRSKRGAGSIIGGVFILLILLTGYTFYFLNVNVTEGYNKILQDMGELDLKRNKENLEFISVSFNNDELNITVKNTGSYNAQLIWLGIFDEGAANTQEYYKIDFGVNPVETVPNIGNDTIPNFEGQERVIQLVTELGNTFSYSYPPSEEEEGSTDIYDFVDDTCDSHTPPAKGTHSFFSAQQAGPDGIVDTLTEEGTGGENAENDVDNNTSNEDGSADKGTETNFTNATGTSLDGNYMNLEETNAGTSGGSEWLDCDAFDSTWTLWTEVGSSPYLSAQDYPTNYIHRNSYPYQNEGWFYFPSTTLTGTLSVNISIYCNNDDGAFNDRADVYVDYTGTGSGSLVGSVAQHTSWQYDTIDLSSHTVGEVNNLRVYFTWVGVSAPDDVRIDHICIGVSSSGSINYQIDFEYQWTTAAHSSDDEEVCIYVGAYTGSETLNVNYWSGSWTPLGTITSTGWNNFTATGLASADYTIQLVGASESSDDYQDDWDIDLITLHTWNASNYELDLEVQWINVDHDEENEWLCIYCAKNGTEPISVDVWNGTAWENVLTGLSSGWNSVDVSSYLVSSTFTIRFRSIGDAVEADDWEIDATFLYVWS